MDKDTASETVMEVETVAGTVMEVEEGSGSLHPSECNLRPKKRKAKDSVNMEGNNGHIDIHSRNVKSKNEDIKNEVNSSCNGGHILRNEDGNGDLRNEKNGNTGGVGDLGSLESKHDDNNDYATKQASVSVGLGKDSVEKDPLRVSLNESDFSKTRFDQCTVSPLSLKGIKDAGYEEMTLVQKAILPVILKGNDVLAKAKTSSGKTVACLLLAIETVINSSPAGCEKIQPSTLVLIISPTMEHANQTAAQASTLLKYHASIAVRVLDDPVEKRQPEPCDILVGTPYWLSYHITNTPGFATRLMGIKLLVLDEADVLLKIFLKFVKETIASVSKERQTLLFSATVTEEVRQFCHNNLKKDHKVINTVQEGCVETLSQNTLVHMVAPMDMHFSSLYVLIQNQTAVDVASKVVVICKTSADTRLVVSFLSKLNLKVEEIHRQSPPGHVADTSYHFKMTKKGIILVTDVVSARAVAVTVATLVIQMGLPADREQYISDGGRIGNPAGKGKCISLIAPYEELFLSSNKNFPVTKTAPPLVDPLTKAKVNKALESTDYSTKQKAYLAWFMLHNEYEDVARFKYRFAYLGYEFSRSMLCSTPPELPNIIMDLLGIKNVPGI